jgi:hypothetical protein
MKIAQFLQSHFSTVIFTPLRKALLKSSFFFAAILSGGVQLASLSARADETCSSPYEARI